MTEQELRLMVRDAIVRHRRDTAVEPPSAPALLFHQHTSHRMFAVPSGAESDGPCLIEPDVMCNHCGYCKSYGH